MPHFATLAVHAGTSPDPVAHGANTPIHLSSTYQLTGEIYDAIHDPARLRHLPFYARYSNPNQQAVARKLSILEAAEDTLVFASGMAAISATLRSLLEPGDTLVAARGLYGGADAFIAAELPRAGVQVVRVDIRDLESVGDALRGARAIYFEPLSNPLLEVADVPTIAAIARSAGALSILDNTFLTPASFRPITHGIDLVIHSATKYLNGHADVIAGTVSGTTALLDRIWPRLVYDGGCLDPHAAWLLERGMKTLELRVARHNENGLALARALVDHPAVARVYYPGLTDDPGHLLAQTLFPGRAGGVLSFDMRGGPEAGLRVLERLSRMGGPFLVATSLGGVESLISMPFNTSHPSPAVRARMGIPDGLVRVSAGIEDPRDLVAALIDALAPEIGRG